MSEQMPWSAEAKRLREQAQQMQVGVDCGTEETVIQIRTIDPEPRNSIDPATGEYRMLIPVEEISREEFAARYPLANAEPQGISVRFSPGNPPAGGRYEISGFIGKLPDDWTPEPEAGERG